AVTAGAGRPGPARARRASSMRRISVGCSGIRIAFFCLDLRRPYWCVDLLIRKNPKNKSAKKKSRDRSPAQREHTTCQALAVIPRCEELLGPHRCWDFPSALPCELVL